ncbi:hypothetical protein DERF_006777 [Dermatophagoides farinae]|uniref:Uncharacterized protein n=1 Tax=Dermatophagoides farinae TaxID=6954 RepID=A0A922L7B8_DERFA|nr:hypothetical protein DERF_006777 [Dermatophagoides farinae]
MCKAFEDETNGCCDDPDDECIGQNGCCCCCYYCLNSECCCGDGQHKCMKCPPECCIKLWNCCNPIQCFTYSNMITLCRSLFLLLHTLLVATSIFGLIWSNVYFNDFDHIFTGTILGGHLVTLSAGGLLFGLSGLYATIKHHRRLLYTHTIINWSLFILRGFTWLLSMLHEYHIDPLLYGLAPIEFSLALLSTMLLRDALIYY